MYAEVTPFAKVIMSGTMPKRCEPNGAPQRPKPVMTSSQIKRMPCFSVRARSAGR
jgi:hypothetical protein